MTERIIEFFKLVEDSYSCLYNHYTTTLQFVSAILLGGKNYYLLLTTLSAGPLYCYTLNSYYYTLDIFSAKIESRNRVSKASSQYLITLNTLLEKEAVSH